MIKKKSKDKIFIYPEGNCCAAVIGNSASIKYQSKYRNMNKQICRIQNIHNTTN